MLAEGTYTASIVGAFTGESPEKQTPYFGIDFQTNGETPQEISWIAYLSEKEFTKTDGSISTMAKENIQLLIKMGFKGRGIADLSDTNKSISDLFDKIDNKITVNVVHEEYTTDSGEVKTVAKIKYVNVGGNINKFDHKQAVAKFKSYNFDGELMRLRKNTPTSKSSGSTEQEPQQNNQYEDNSFADGDIPF